MKYCVIGKRGFIGSALSKKLGDTSFYPEKDTEVLFYFDSVVHMDFEKNMDYHMNKVIQEFLYLLPYCRDHNIKFVFASSALVYEKDTSFTKCKAILENLAACYPNTLALRIFPVYGPGEHRTIISKWCEEMKKGKQPEVFGEGEQSRDFIYIDDVVDQIISLVEKNISGIVDIGAGQPKSFNHIIDTINKVLGTNIEAVHIDPPKGYSQGIYCHSPLPTKVTLEDGIRKILLEQEI